MSDVWWLRCHFIFSEAKPTSEFMSSEAAGEIQHKCLPIPLHLHLPPLPKHKCSHAKSHQVHRLISVLFRKCKVCEVFMADEEGDEESDASNEYQKF